MSIWSYEVSTIRICIEFGVGFAFTVYIIILSIMSPCPPMLDNFVGSFLAVLSQIVYQCIFMRVKCLIATRLERFGQKYLILIGVCTMSGQLLGGVLIYLIVNVLELFKSTPDCVFDYKLYCK